MHIDLSDSQCTELLKKNHYAHLGCIDDSQPYVIPITYIYENGYIYSFSLEGQKIEAMRKNPAICIQVEYINGEHEWQSVICWGNFEEVTGVKDAQNAKLLMAELHGQAILQKEEPLVSQIVESWKKRLEESVVYRVKPTRMTGKGESI